MIYKGKIVKVMPFGFIVQLEDPSSRYRKDGLVHIS